MKTASRPGATDDPRGSPSGEPSGEPALAAFAPHDHRRCARAARAVVERECRARGLRLTPARGFVLDALLDAEHRAFTAYELLDRLREAGLGKQPPIVYRALDFLVANGFVHRIERLGAYVACVHGAGRHAAAFLVCRSCRTVAEIVLPGPEDALAGQAGSIGFRLERVTVEAEGLCAGCAGRGA
jgi:Fur family transcriptional regulator, zinc uptake regulator